MSPTVRGRGAIPCRRAASSDADRLIIRGGSAGGYTTLCALTFTDTFKAGASLYGIGDLMALLRDTHKFESRDLDNLIAPLPGGEDVYRARSPLFHTDRLDCPVIFSRAWKTRSCHPTRLKRWLTPCVSRACRSPI